MTMGLAWAACGGQRESGHRAEPAPDATAQMWDDSGPDASRDASTADVGKADATNTIIDANVDGGCSCFDGTYDVVRKDALPQLFPKFFELTYYCNGTFRCTLPDNQNHMCFVGADSFYIYTDTAGYTAFIFKAPLSCSTVWSGLYASEGAESATIEATRR